MQRRPCEEQALGTRSMVKPYCICPQCGRKYEVGEQFCTHCRERSAPERGPVCETRLWIVTVFIDARGAKWLRWHAPNSLSKSAIAQIVARSRPESEGPRFDLGRIFKPLGRDDQSKTARDRQRYEEMASNYGAY